MVIHETVIEAIHAVMLDLTSLGKTEQNTHQHYSFRGVDSVVNAVGPLLREHGLVVAPVDVACEFTTLTTNSGNTMGHAQVTVTYVWVLPGQPGLTVQVVGEAFDSGDKAIPKAMSVAYRTMFLQTLCLPTGEPDPDAQTYNRNDTTPADSRKPTKAMTGKMWALIKQLGWSDSDEDRQAIHDAMSGIVGRTVTTSKDLTRSEVQMVIESIERRLKGD